jgi:hypothetical protein
LRNLLIEKGVKMANRNVCIIQGDIRTKYIDTIIQEMQKHFDKVIVSTWQGEESKLPKGNYEVILNCPPSNKGFSHRNYQRLSTSSGLRLTKELNAEFVLKWRTDCLPTNFDLRKLIQQANYNIPAGFSSRLVMPAFRNLTVNPDWFSSFPDHFTFGRINEMEMLWGDSGINYSLDFNYPQEMFSNPMIELIADKMYYNSNNYTDSYDAHVELYAIYKSRLQKLTEREISHPEIARNYLCLIDHNQLKICWFGGNGKFRSITQVLIYPWWTEDTFSGKSTYKIVQAGYKKVEPFREVFYANKTKFFILRNRMMQSAWFKEYRRAQDRNI